MRSQKRIDPCLRAKLRKKWRYQACVSGEQCFFEWRFRKAMKIGLSRSVAERCASAFVASAVAWSRIRSYTDRPSRLTRICCRIAGLACRNSANWPCGRTTQLVNWSYGSPTASMTACSISAGVPASGSPSSVSPLSNVDRSNPRGNSSSPAWVVAIRPLPSRRTTRVAAYRAPAASNTSRTRASAAEGASALATERRSLHRGTVP